MFSYYGSKSKIIKYYPEPTYYTIIDPFCGSARYPLLYYQKNCWINDSYKSIYDIWNWIVNLTEEEFITLPNLGVGDDLRSVEISDGAKKFFGFVVNSGVVSPRYVVTKWSHEKGEFKRHKERLLKYLGKLTHWKVTNLDYREIPNIECTWFIDPPYQHGGELYIENKINYSELAEWCKSRKGQVIVCENSSATWLPFTPLKELYGQKKKTMEMIWYKERN